jgi:putative ABC transport system permease protein
MLATMVRRSLRHNLRVTMWTLATLSTCAALAALFTAVAVDAAGAMGASLRRLGANALVTARGDARAGAAHEVDWRRVAAAAQRSGVDLCVLESVAGTLGGRPVAVVEADPAALARLTRYWAVSGARARSSGECLVGRRLAGVFGLAAGTPVTVERGTGGARQQLTVTGVFDSGDDDENRIFVPASPAPMTGDVTSPAPGLLTYALASVKGGEAGIAAFAGVLGRAAPGAEVEPLRQVVHGEHAIVAKVELLAGVTLLAVTVLAALGVSAAVLARVVERRAELALLQALGARGRTVIAFLLGEAATLGVIAALTGFVLGQAIAEIVLRRSFGTLVRPGVGALAASFVVGVAVALLAGAAGVRRARRLPPAAALRGE